MDGERLDSGFVTVANASGQPDGGVRHQVCKFYSSKMVSVEHSNSVFARPKVNEVILEPEFRNIIT